MYGRKVGLSLGTPGPLGPTGSAGPSETLGPLGPPGPLGSHEPLGLPGPLHSWTFWDLRKSGFFGNYLYRNKLSYNLARSHLYSDHVLVRSYP